MGIRSLDRPSGWTGEAMDLMHTLLQIGARASYKRRGNVSSSKVLFEEHASKYWLQ